MLSVKKCNFFRDLFSLKIRPEKRFNNVLDRKKKLFLTIKTNFFIVSKIDFFQSPPKKVNPCS